MTEELKPEAKPEAKAAKAAKLTSKLYTTSEKHTIPIDVQIKGEVINGEWSQKDGYVNFSVPAHLVEGFELHYHFKAGNIIAVKD